MPTYTVSGVADGNGNSAATSITIDVSSLSIANGDYVGLLVNANNNSPLPTVDAGGATFSTVRDVDCSSDSVVTAVNSETARMTLFGKTAASEPTSYTVQLGASRQAQVIAFIVRSSNGSSASWSISDAAVTFMDASGPRRLMRMNTDGDVIPADSVALYLAGADTRGTTGTAYSSAQTGTPAEMTFIASDGDNGSATGAYYVDEAAGITLSGDSFFQGVFNNDYTYGIYYAIEDTGGGADVTAPVLTSPTAGSLTTDGVTPSVTTDEGNGTLYWGIYADAASPTAAQVVAGTSAILSGSQAVSGTGSQAVSAQTGLDDATSYELFFVHDDAAANRSNLSTVGFTTSTDSTAPSLTSPTAGSVSSTSVAPTVTTDTAEGTAYARVYANGATPTASQVQSGTGVTPVGSSTNITVGASGALNFSTISGLTEGTDYELYFVHEDDATTPNLSAVSTVGFTTTVAARSVELTAANGYELRDETGSVVASLNGIVWEWYDDPDSTTGTPTDSGTFNTSAGGEATITITGSGLADGAFGQLIVRHPTNDEIRGNYYLPITVS